MLDRRWPDQSLGWFFLLALVLHGALLTWRTPEFLKTVTSPGSAPIPLELAAPSREDLPVVRTDRADEQIEDDRPARFGGEFRNRVKRESQAARRGRYQQGRPRPTVPDAGEAGEGAEGFRGDWNDLLAFPQSPHAIPGEVAQGDRTLLNTDPVLYAGFINRVADEIYDPWVSHATRAAERVMVSGRKVGGRTYITKLTVVINRRGEVASLKILQSSGLPELDEAPKRAFWDSEPFLNPPSQMFDDDELVRFVYEFHFEWKNNGLNIVPLI